MAKTSKPDPVIGAAKAGEAKALNINPHLRGHERSRPDAEALLAGILRGDRAMLGRAITLVESRSPRLQGAAQSIIAGCLPHSGRSLRLAVTGAPGVGKSTLIETLGRHALRRGRRLAVLAIDPSSQYSKGSILADKTRMETLAQNPNAFIRPSPAGEVLGGVAFRTRESILLCEAAGYDLVIVETVGVGQSEIAAHAMVDCFLLLLLPGAGDELQGLKRGIVEMADIIAINKADGERQLMAHQARRAYRNALHLMPPKESEWTPPVLTCSAGEDLGVDQLWESIENYHAFIRHNGYFDHHRREQTRFWLRETIDAHLRERFFRHPKVAEKWSEFEKAAIDGAIAPTQAAEMLLRMFLDE